MECYAANDNTKCTRCVSSAFFDSVTTTCFIPVCGNGIREPSEECDDGNMLNNDGCSSKCTIEDGYSCI